MAKRVLKLQEFIAHASGTRCLNIGKKTCRVFVTGGEDKKVNLWAIGKPNPLLSLSGHTSSVESITFDSSEVLVLAGASTGIIKLWDLEDPKAVRTLSGHRSKCSSLEFHPFGEFFASGSSDTDLKIWDIRKKGCIHTYKGHTRGITTIRFTPDGRWLVSGGEDNIVKLWDLTAGKLLHEFKSHNGAIRSIDFHPHEFLLGTGSADRTVKFWDLETFELIGSAGPEVTGGRSMIFHPDGKTLFCGLEQTLKVFSWEPVRCHDDVDVGWSVLGDLGIYDGKLLGCSYNECSVGVWAADLSLIGPYAAGGFSKSSAFVEPEFKSVADHDLNSFSAHMNANDDQQIDTKEIIHTETRTYKPDDIIGKSYGRDSSIKVPKEGQNVLATSKGNKYVSNRLLSQTFDANSMTKSCIASFQTSKDGDSIGKKAGTPKTNRSNFLRKGTTKPSRLKCDNISLAGKDSMLDIHRGNNKQINKSICTPVVVMRDSVDLLKPKIQSENLSPDEEAHDARLCRPSSFLKSSFVDIGNENESRLVSAQPGTLGRSDDVANVVMDIGFRPKSRGDSSADSEMDNHDDIETATEAFQRVFFLDPSFGAIPSKDQETHQNTAEFNSSNSVKGGITVGVKDLDSAFRTTEANSVKYVKGVAVQHGRTRSLVESWEKREKLSSGCILVDSSLSMTPQASNPSIPSNDQPQSSANDCTTKDDVIVNSLMQSRDQFINLLKSRLTKLQMVRHCWEQHGIKGAINSVAKLPDLPVQVDVISILTEKANLLTLDFFSCLLPILVGLLSSKTERHTEISLEMLLNLVKLFWPVVHSTIYSYSPVGVDIEAEERVNRCRQIFSQFEKVREILPSLFRKGGSIARRSLELNLTLDR